MKGMRWLFVLCLAWTLPALALESREQTFEVGADVNAQGEVTGTQPEAGTAKPIAALLDLALKHWRFVPVRHDGKAVPVHTFIDARVDALPGENGKYTVRVTYVRHGPSWDRAQDPHYPADSVRRRESGIVVITGSLQSDGKIVIADVRSLTSGNSGGRSPLKKTSTDWVSHHVITPETVDGQAIPAQLRVFVRFDLHEYVPGEPGPAGEQPLLDEQRKLVLDAGFTDPGDGKVPVTPEISSVLQTSDIRPISLQL